MSARFRWACFALLVALLPVTASAAEESEARLAMAIDLFNQGVALLQANSVEAALAKFLKSREILRSSSNTTNAAICLERLGRYDEALEMYEEVATRYAAELSADQRVTLRSTIAALTKKVGTLEVSANVDGALVVDGRRRGKLPLAVPLRVVAGTHRLRILKDGYTPYEATFQAAAGTRTEVDALLAPLRGVGSLRVEDATLPDGAVFVDGAAVGRVPWDGTLAAGRHVIWTAEGDRGSAPSAQIVLEGQTTLVRLSSKELGAELRVDVQPRAAQISIDGVAVADGHWSGRLPVGGHEVRASEPGYRPQVERVSVRDRPEGSMTREFRLVVDPDDPRWPARPAGPLEIGLFAAFAATTGLKTSPASNLSPGAFGLFTGGRVGYRFPLGFAPELSAGFVTLSSSFQRHYRDTYDDNGYPVEYRLTDDVWFRGPFGYAGGSFRTPVGRFALIGRAGAGAAYARVRDPVHGRAYDELGSFLPVIVPSSEVSQSGVALLMLGELALALPLGPLDLALSLGVAGFPLVGPTLPRPEIGVNSSCDKTPDYVGCSPNSPVLARDRAFGPFWLWLPGLSFAYRR